MDKLVRVMIEQDLLKAFAEYGVEGCEQKIVECYSWNEYLKQQYLRVYKDLIKTGVHYA